MNTKTSKHAMTAEAALQNVEGVVRDKSKRHTWSALSSGVTSGSSVDVAAPTTAPRLWWGASGKDVERNVAGSQLPAG